MMEMKLNETPYWDNNSDGGILSFPLLVKGNNFSAVDGIVGQ